jgi:hypothetical protein
VDAYTHIFLSLALDEIEWSALRPDRFNPGKDSQVLFGQESGQVSEPVWTMWRGENSCPYQDSISEHSVVLPVTSHYTDYAIPAKDEVPEFLKFERAEEVWNVR